MTDWQAIAFWGKVCDLLTVAQSVEGKGEEEAIAWSNEIALGWVGGNQLRDSGSGRKICDG